MWKPRMSATNVQARMPAANVFDVFNYKVPIMK